MNKGLMVQKELKDLQPRRQQFKEPNDFNELLAVSKVLVASKILPKEIDTAEKAAVVILTGRELGLQMMAATRGICVVNQRPALYAQMMLALAINTGEMEDYQIIEKGKGDAASCEMIVKRKGRSPYSYTFSVDMIKKLEKYQNEWKKQPETMCKWRAISGNLRVTFPDAILGLYTPEETATIDETIIDAGPIVDLKNKKDAPAGSLAQESPKEEGPQGTEAPQENVAAAPADKKEEIKGLGAYYEIGIVATEGALPDYGRFGADDAKIKSLAMNVKKCGEKLGKEKFMQILGNMGFESTAQINTVQEVAALLNALLEG